VFWKCDAKFVQYPVFSFNNTSMDRFGYEPIDLEGCSFRLLQLRQGMNGPIECHLFDARLDSIIEYDALSYTWGGSEQPYEIKINDSTMPVTVNLSQALWDLRHPDKDRLLWVDAICINQEDIKERGHQVKHMASIYKRAEQVIVWLGRSTPDTKVLFCYMHQMETQANEHAYHGWTASDERWQDLWSAAKPMFDDDSTGWLSRQRHGLKSILSRSWFTRVWIIQEIVNARSARIMCGSATVSAAVFAVMPSLLDIKVDPHCQAILDIMPGPLRKQSWWAQNRNLRMLLLKFRWSKASNPRDTIYALLGISSDACDTKYLVLDYKLSIGEVLHKTMGFILYFRDQEIAAPPLPQYTLPEFIDSLESISSRLLSWASETGNVALASRIFDMYGTNAKELGVDGEILLMSAVRNGHRTMAQLLHDRGVSNIDAKDKYDKMALFTAVVNGDETLVKLILEIDRADINMRNERGATPLTVAVQNGDDRIVEELSRNNASAMKDIDRLTTLMIAVCNRHYGLVELLLRTGARADTKSKSASRSLVSAIQSGRGGIVQLVSQALDIDATSRKNILQMELFVAAECGHDSTVQLLLDMGKLELNANTKARQASLSLATQEGNEEVIKLLVGTGEVDVFARDKNGETPLLLAVRNRHVEVVKLLIDTGETDVLAINEIGETPLSLAVRYGDIEIIKIFREFGGLSQDDLYKEKGITLLLAMRMGNEEIAKGLLKSGECDVNERDSNGCTPLLFAARWNWDEVAELLLERRIINVDLEDIENQTPLTWAAQNGNEWLLRRLLQTGKVNVDHKDRYRRTPLHRAVRRNDLITSRILIQDGKADVESFRFCTPGLRRRIERWQLDGPDFAGLQ
jgi:ankyrin repeat protein